MFGGWLYLPVEARTYLAGKPELLPLSAAVRLFYLSSAYRRSGCSWSRSSGTTGGTLSLADDLDLVCLSYC
ncbi:MAG TPA: hypothetical protein VH186_20145 [Chloroflexia bacterium]|nr:hypothetical protein [Chloroflexia bacterium]